MSAVNATSSWSKERIAAPRELRSATLAEGEYVAIARHDSKTYQTTFKVESGVDKDVEVSAKETPPPEAP